MAREVLEVAPERVHEAAVAAARAAAADVLLEDHDVDPGIELLELDGRPHPGVAAAEDHDVRRDDRRGAAAPARRDSSCASASRSHQLDRRRGGIVVTAVRASLLGSPRILAPHLAQFARRRTSGRETIGPAQRPRSWEVTEGPHRAPARAMLRAVGFSRGGLRQAAGGRGLDRGTRSRRATTTSASSPRSRRRACARAARCRSSSRRSRSRDGIAMGHEGMKASLISRDLIADSVELVMHAERLDALVGIAGCDKSEPGMLMAMARLNLPASTSTAARSFPAPTRAATSRSRTCSRPSAPTRRARSTTTELLGDRARRVPHRPARAPACTPRTRWRRSARRSACRCPGAASPAGRRLPARGLRARERDRAAELARRRRAAPARHPHEGGVRERDRGRDGARGLDERRAAPPRDRARGRRGAAARRLRPDLARHVRTSSTSGPAGQVRDERSRPRRRRAGRDAGAAGRRTAARRLPDGDRADDRREPRRPGARPRPTATIVQRAPTRSTRGAGPRSSAATLAPERRGREDRPAPRGSTFRGRSRGRSTPSRRRSTPSRPARSRRAT